MEGWTKGEAGRTGGLSSRRKCPPPPRNALGAARQPLRQQSSPPSRARLTTVPVVDSSGSRLTYHAFSARTQRNGCASSVILT
jgi:hypothetical protein